MREKLLRHWQQKATRTKVIVLSIIFLSILGGSILTIFWIKTMESSQTGTVIPPYGTYTLDIKDEKVFVSGEVFFTVYCNFTSHGGYPVDPELVFHIQAVFVCQGRCSINSTLVYGDILDVSNTTVTLVTGDDWDLRPYEVLSVKFKTDYPFEERQGVYVGVFADGPTGLMRWDQYTRVLKAEPVPTGSFTMEVVFLIMTSLLLIILKRRNYPK
ncbi:MAG: hypothetical protein ACFFBD_16085 [Candidatus Hodarchaeota archaeon]